MDKYIGFDIEIAKELPDEIVDWKDHRPLGITCAALYDGSVKKWYYTKDDQGEYASQMSKTDAQELVKDLMVLVEKGYMIVTWNGLSFDFNVLAEESGMYDECKVLALNHMDLMFQFLCIKGYPVGIDAVADFMLGSGKPDDVSGAQAPQLWREGHYQTVLDYVANDVVMTYDLIMRIIKKGNTVSWVSKKGRTNHCKMGELRIVKNCFDIAEPNTSWMANPMVRQSFYEWTE